MSRNDGRVSGARRRKRNKLVQRRQRRRRDKMKARGRKPEQVAVERVEGD
jgi:hypothetical protein